MQRSTRRTRVLTLAALLAAVPACSDAPSAVTPVEPAAARVVSQPDDAADPVVLALAEALADPAVRRRFWEDLRDSPFKSHRLHLQSYLRGPGGKPILQEGARATGQSEAELLARLGSLPQMEIIVPVELHRLEWAGTPDVVVAGSALPLADLGRRGTVQGYTTAGEPVTVPLFSRVSYPLVVLRQTELSFGADPEMLRQRAPRKGRNTISTPEEEFSTSSCDTEFAIMECDTTGGGGSPAGGLAIPSGYTYQCMVSAYAPGDSDGDSILDQCEAEIAHAFRPYMAYATNDSDTRREEYWASMKGDNAYAVQIFYALSYYNDGGDPETGGSYAHQGDSEWIVMQVSYHGGLWRVDRAKLSAHWGTATNSTETVGYDGLTYPDGTYRGRPLVWAARNKHANYKSQGACDAGAYWADSCDTNVYNTYDPYYAVEALSNANLGNTWHKLINCVLSREGQPYGRWECYWEAGYKFYGWQSPADEGAGPYRDALVAHNF